MMPDPHQLDPSALFDDPTRPAFGDVGADHEPPARDLEGRLAVVTGATGLLGAAVATELVRRGAVVGLLARDLVALDDLVAELGPDATALVLRADLADAADIASAVEFVQRLDRPVDVVVHAAGLQSASRIADGLVESLDEHYLLNVRGPYLLTQQLLPLLAPAARVVFFATEQPGDRPGDAHHGITAAAGRALADELRTEAGAAGLRVLSVLASHGDDDAAGRFVDPVGFAGAVASAVVDAVLAADVDLTELRVRGVAHPTRSERR